MIYGTAGGTDFLLICYQISIGSTGLQKIPEFADVIMKTDSRSTTPSYSESCCLDDVTVIVQGNNAAKSAWMPVLLYLTMYFKSTTFKPTASDGQG